MNRRKDGPLERLRRLARVSDRVLQGLATACGQQLPGPGRPCSYALDVQVLVLLVKLRLDLPYRALEVISGIDTVTASRMVKRMLERLSEWTWCRRPEPTGFYLVDTTTVRVRIRQDNYYSGYKHHRGMKTQVLADEGGVIHHLSAAWPARVHDKVIWDRTLEQLYPLLRRPVLADKAYAGAHLEGYGLIRPIKHNEQGYLAAPEQAKAFNRELSRRRVRIEHVMASLKRLRILGGRFSLALKWYPAVMKAVALVHNLERASV